MEASHFLQSRRFATALPHHRHMHAHKLRRSSIVAVLSTPADVINIEADKSSIRPADGAAEKKIVYNDNWFDKLAIDHLSQNVQAASGFSSSIQEL